MERYERILDMANSFILNFVIHLVCPLAHNRLRYGLDLSVLM